MKRRNFIKRSAFVSAGTLLVPQFIRAMQMTGNSIGSAKKLVVVQLSGGNDGLNTVVPYRNDLYYQLRPVIAINQREVLKVGDSLGLNPALEGIRKLFDNGDATIINSVGYPNPDRSHFRSMDIWQTASASDEYLSHGWLGKYLDQSCIDCQAYQAIEVDDALSLALKGANRKALSLKDPAKLYRATRGLYKKQLDEVKHQNEHSNLGYLYKTMAETIESAEYVFEQSKVYKTGQSYPNNAFGRDLKLVAQLINSGIDTEIFYVSLNGFDTHANQNGRQNNLLKNYDAAISAFVKDLKSQGNWTDTLVMTFSEFGRRVAQNASRGTDHGTANNLMLFGGSLKKPGFYNQAPDLSNLDSGDLIYQVDFRNVYASVLNDWLSTDSTRVLGSRFDSLDLF